MISEIRIGKVSRIDYQRGRAAVTFSDKEDSVTELMPCLCIGGEYFMPKLEQYVLVGHLSTGSEKGVIIGPFWTQKHHPPDGAEKGYYRKSLDEESNAFVECDSQGNLTISAPAITLRTATGTITVDEIIAALQGQGGEG